MSDLKAVASLAERLDDSTRWTPADAVRDCLKDIESGEINPEHLVIHYYEETEDGRLRPGYYCANVTHESHVSLLELAKLKCIEEWRDG